MVKYRILLVGDSPAIPTGYGVQLKELGKRFLEQGNEVIYFDTSFPMDKKKGEIYKLDQFLTEYFNREVKEIEFPFIDVRDELKNALITFKNTDEPFPFKQIQEIVEKTQSDCYIVVKDLNNYPDNLKLNIPSISWCPLDCFPISPSILSKLKLFSKVISISEYGKKEMIKYGYDVDFISHSLNTTIIDEINKKDRNFYRDKYGIPKDKFVVGIIASNTESNNRKGWNWMLDAFKTFNEKYNDTYLFINTNLDGTTDSLKTLKNQIGLDLYRYMNIINLKNWIGIPEKKYRKYSQKEIYEQMKCFDVLLSTSRGEGCSVCLLESQLLNIPVITSDFTAMSENCMNGILIPPYCLEYKMTGSYHCIPDIKKIPDALEEIYLNPDEYDRKDIVEKIKRNTDYKVNGDKFLLLIDELITDYKINMRKLKS